MIFLLFTVFTSVCMVLVHFMFIKHLISILTLVHIIVVVVCKV